MVNYSKPLAVLVEKIANALGRHFDPSQITRIAIAEAEASGIQG